MLGFEGFISTLFKSIQLLPGVKTRKSLSEYELLCGNICLIGTSIVQELLKRVFRIFYVPLGTFSGSLTLGTTENLGKEVRKEN